MPSDVRTWASDLSPVGLRERRLAIEDSPRDMAVGQEDAAAALALINQRYALAPLAEEEVELRRMALAHDAVDRTGERFGLPFLQRLAETLPGKPVLAFHDKRSWPVGRFYGAELVKDPLTSVTWLVARWYLVRTAENEGLRRSIDAGVVAHVSIGFRGGELICELCGEPFWSDCPHWPGQEVFLANGSPATCSMEWQDPRGTAEAVEGSLVWLGAQQGAQLIKSFEETFLDELKDLKGQLEAARSREAVWQSARHALEKDLADWQTRHQEAEARQATLATELADLTRQVDGLKALAADGQIYRDDLVAEVCRLGGIVDAAGEAEVVCGALKEAGAARLKVAKDEYQRRVDAKFPPSDVGTPAAVETPSRAGGSGHPRAHTLV